MAETKKKEECNIYQKLQMIQVDMKAPKDLYNKFGNYAYRNAESICEAVKPFERDYGVLLMLSDSIEQIGDRFYVVATATLINCVDGQSISVSARAREEETKKGMDQAQITGATSSYARKYALNGLFLLDDTKDADSEEYHEQAENKAKAEPKAKAKPTTNIVTNANKEEQIEDAKKEKARADLLKLQKEFVAYCNSNGIDYHKYELKTDSPKSAFEDAYAKAKQEVAEKKGELPFPLDD